MKKRTHKKEVRFNFGENWKEFSENALDESKLRKSMNSLNALIGKDRIKGSCFLDIGCGSGLFSIAASLMGAKKVVAFDVSKESIGASLINKKKFAPNNKISFSINSVFDAKISKLGKFDIVYSWGVLHHTGKMLKSIDISTSLVKKNGLFVIAIYEKHWSSLLWKLIKKTYNISPKYIKKIMIMLFYWVIAFAKLVVTKKNPFADKKRGMDFYYDVVDWMGGYPYEYASRQEIESYVEKKGFKLVRFVKSHVPTGCNEYVFSRN